jgi:hypothetical protein
MLILDNVGISDKDDNNVGDMIQIVDCNRFNADFGHSSQGDYLHHVLILTLIHNEDKLCQVLHTILVAIVSSIL